jgi:hypothetical protein
MTARTSRIQELEAEEPDLLTLDMRGSDFLRRTYEDPFLAEMPSTLWAVCLAVLEATPDPVAAAAKLRERAIQHGAVAEALDAQLADAVLAAQKQGPYAPEDGDDPADDDSPGAPPAAPVTRKAR